MSFCFFVTCHFVFFATCHIFSLGHALFSKRRSFCEESEKKTELEKDWHRIWRHRRLKCDEFSEKWGRKIMTLSGRTMLYTLRSTTPYPALRGVVAHRVVAQTVQWSHTGLSPSGLSPSGWLSRGWLTLNSFFRDLNYSEKWGPYNHSGLEGVSSDSAWHQPQNRETRSETKFVDFGINLNEWNY
jgi:hypothetical protein